MKEQILSLWQHLHEQGVRYLTIGGLAVAIYGYNRLEGNIEIYIEDTEVNRRNLRAAVKAMGLGDFKELATLPFLPGWTDFSLDQGLRLDIMTSIKGLEEKSFDELQKLATVLTIQGVPVYFLDYANLIIAKKAANRPKDQLDIEELEKLNGKL